MTFCVIGKDERQAFLAGHLSEHGAQLIAPSAAATADAVVFPLPIAKEQRAFERLLNENYSGIIFGGLIDLEGRKNPGGAKIHDYAKSEYFSQLNAVASAEGGLFEMMTHSRRTLQGSEVLMFGYGRIAEHMTRLLLAFGAKVTVCARKPEQRAKAEAIGALTCSFLRVGDNMGGKHFIVNTVPAPILGYDLLKRARRDVYLLDLASAPGGIVTEDATACGYTVNWALAVPARYSPDTAAGYVLQAINEILSDTGVHI